MPVHVSLSLIRFLRGTATLPFVAWPSVSRRLRTLRTGAACGAAFPGFRASWAAGGSAAVTPRTPSRHPNPLSRQLCGGHARHRPPCGSRTRPPSPPACSGSRSSNCAGRSRDAPLDALPDAAQTLPAVGVGFGDHAGDDPSRLAWRLLLPRHARLLRDNQDGSPYCLTLECYFQPLRCLIQNVTGDLAVLEVAFGLAPGTNGPVRLSSFPNAKWKLLLLILWHLWARGARVWAGGGQRPALSTDCPHGPEGSRRPGGLVHKSTGSCRPRKFARDAPDAPHCVPAHSGSAHAPA